MKIKLAKCKECNELIYVKTRRLYCDKCKKKLKSLRVMRARARKDPRVKVGVGSGGNQKGPNNPYYRGGYANYKKIYKEHKPNRYCEHCGSKKNLVIHHKDGNRKNADILNLIELCRSCHSIEHKLHLNFK